MMMIEDHQSYHKTKHFAPAGATGAFPIALASDYDLKGENGNADIAGGAGGRHGDGEEDSR